MDYLEITQLDHVSLIVNDLDTSVKFYTQILGFKNTSNGDSENNTIGLLFGNSKLNLKSVNLLEGHVKPKHPTPGSSILCFLTSTPLKECMKELKAKEIPICAGPERHMGANNLLISIQVNDPDGNVIEIANKVT